MLTAVDRTKANPDIQFDEWNMAVSTKLTPYPVAPTKCMSGSGFGMGGTNGHVVLESSDPTDFSTGQEQGKTFPRLRRPVPRNDFPSSAVTARPASSEMRIP
ncbi:unnamed protein product [Penicillium glandicola]